MNGLLEQCKQKMKKSIDALGVEFTSIRAGRANPAILNKITVDYYGVPTQISQMAAVSVIEARILQIQPWDISTLKPIEKAILASDIGITPNNDGKVIRLAFPPLTEERRRDITKDIKRYAEECKISVRSVRREALDKYRALEKKSEISEDDLKMYEKKIQEQTDNFCKEVDDLAASKEKEILEI